MLTKVKASSAALLHRCQVNIIINIKTLHIKKRLCEHFARLLYAKCRINAGNKRIKKNEKQFWMLECHSSIKCNNDGCLQHSRYNLTKLLAKYRQCTGHNPIYTASLNSLDSSWQLSDFQIIYSQKWFKQQAI